MALSRRQQKAMFAKMNSPRASPIKPKIIGISGQKAENNKDLFKAELRNTSADPDEGILPKGKVKVKGGPYNTTAGRYEPVSKGSSHIRDNKTGDIYFYDERTGSIAVERAGSKYATRPRKGEKIPPKILKHGIGTKNSPNNSGERRY